MEWLNIALLCASLAGFMTAFMAGSPWLTRLGVVVWVCGFAAATARFAWASPHPPLGPWERGMMSAVAVVALAAATGITAYVGYLGLREDAAVKPGN